MVQEATVWVIWSLVGCYLWQPDLCEVVWEPSVPWQVEPHRDQILLYQGYGAERNSEALVCCDGWADSGCVDQTTNQGEVWVLQREAWCSLDRRYFEEEVMGHICRIHSKHGRRILPMAMDVSIVWWASGWCFSFCYDDDQDDHMMVICIRMMFWSVSRWYSMDRLYR